MRLSMKKEQPASSTILLLDWLATEQKKQLHVYALKIVVILQPWQLKAVFCLWTITFSKWSQYILSAFFILFSTCILTRNIVPSTNFFFPFTWFPWKPYPISYQRAKHLNPQALGWHTPIYICVAYRVGHIMITFSGISHCNLGGGGKTNSGSPLQWPSSL